MFTQGGMPSQPINSGLGFDYSERTPSIRRSISSPVGSNRAAQLRSIRSQIEMLEAHLKHISPTKQNDSTPTVAFEASGEPVISENSKTVSTVKEVDYGSKSGDAPEINLDESARRRVAEEEDQSPQALRRRASAAAALRRISSNSSSQKDD